jgi:hypothetical protein
MISKEKGGRRKRGQATFFLKKVACPLFLKNVIANGQREHGNLNNLIILKLAQPSYQTIKTRSRPEEQKNKH